MLRIAAYTNGDVRTASARLRSFYLFDFQKEAELSVERELPLLQSLRSNVLHLQKCYLPKYLLQAMLFRILGKAVVFDIDDQAVQLKHRIALIAMFHVSSFVTTDTPEREEFICNYVNRKKVVVLKDIVDVEPGRSELTVPKGLNKANGLLWIGHRDNFPSILPVINSDLTKRGFRFIVVTKITENDELAKAHPTVEFMQWERDITLDREIGARYMVLNHDSTADANAKYKSENKMVLSIVSGLIPIVSRTPSYLRLAQMLDAERLVFDEVEEIPGILASITREWEEEFIIRAQEHVRRNFVHERILDEFKSLVL